MLVLARDAADQSRPVERLHGVGHVARLQVGERAAVGHDVLQRLDVGVVDRRVVDVGQHSSGDRVPDLRRRVACRAQAVLAREVEVRERARGTRRCRGLGCWRGGDGQPADDEGPRGEQDHSPAYSRATVSSGADGVSHQLDLPVGRARQRRRAAPPFRRAGRRRNPTLRVAQSAASSVSFATVARLRPVPWHPSRRAIDGEVSLVPCTPSA